MSERDIRQVAALPQIRCLYRGGKLVPANGERPDVVVYGDLKPGHYLFLINRDQIDVEEFADAPGLLPEGSTGGAVFAVQNVEIALSIYRLGPEKE